MAATAAEMTPDELLQGIEVFSARSQALGSKPWTAGEVCAPASLRLYRAGVSELFVIDRDDQRMRAEIGEQHRQCPRAQAPLTSPPLAQVGLGPPWCGARSMARGPGAGQYGLWRVTPARRSLDAAGYGS